MSLAIKNTRDLIDPDNYKMKVLVYSLPGAGKSEWASGAPNPGIAACETGHGSGLLTVASKGLDYVEPSSYADFEVICGGGVFKDKESIIIDSLSDMTRTFIKDFALTIPRSKGNSPKRERGVPELDDYGVMGEITRRLLRKLLDQPKHVIVTATMRIEHPDMETGKGQYLVQPDLPGQLAAGSVAMFDLVLCLRTRPKLKDPKDPKSRYNERYFITDQTSEVLAKCRSVVEPGKSLLAPEEVFNLQTGEGTFEYLHRKIVDKYKEGVVQK